MKEGANAEAKRRRSCIRLYPQALDRNDEGRSVKLEASKQHIGRLELMDGLRDRFESRMWTNVTHGEAIGGLEKGTRSLEQAKKCQHWLRRKGKGDQARCLESIFAYSVWNAARLHVDPALRQYRGCGNGIETLRHIFGSAQKMGKLTTKEYGSHSTYASKPSSIGRTEARAFGTEEYSHTTSGQRNRGE